jgi:outer membrane protein assembly factor BamB
MLSQNARSVKAYKMTNLVKASSIALISLSLFLTNLSYAAEAFNQTDPMQAWPNFRNGTSNSGGVATEVKQLVDRFSSQTELREIREFKTNGLIWATPILDEAGNLYFGSANKTFYSLDPAGQLCWSYSVFDRADALIDSAAALVPQTDLVVIPGGDGYLHALHRDTQGLAWTFHAYHSDNETHQSGTVVNSFEGNVQVNSNGLIYAGSDNGYLYAVNHSGQEVWSMKTNMMIWSSPAFGPDNHWMAFGSLDGHLYLVDPMTGAPLSKPYEAHADIKTSPATDKSGNIYFGTSGGKLFSLSTKSGKATGPSKYQLHTNWAYPTHGEIYSSPALTGNRVIFGSQDGRLYCLDTRGHLVWEYATYSPISSSPIVTKDGVVLFGAKNGKFYAIDLESGNRIWSLRTASDLAKANLDSSPALDSTGMIHVGSYHGVLYSIPYEFCLNHTQDPRCEFGGTTDSPDFKGPVNSNQATIQLYSEPIIEAGSPVQLKLAAFKNGVFVDRASIDANSYSVKITPPASFKTQVSSDGKYLNIFPTDFFAAGVHYQVEVSGKYFIKTRSWFWDRLQFFTTPFKGTAEFETRPPQKEILNSVQPGTTLSWGFKSFYLKQPEALDTYIPAALEGQAFLATAFHFNPENHKTLMLVIPALPRPDGFKILAEPSKVFSLNGTYQDNNVKGEGTFRIAAMGGDMTFSPMTFSMTLRPDSPEVNGQFHAVASCRTIHGNGTQYTFPSLLVNQVCDPWLNVIALGTFHGTGFQNQDLVTNPASATVLSTTKISSDKMAIQLQVRGDHNMKFSDPHLLTWVEMDESASNIITHRSQVISPDALDTDGTWRGELPLLDSKKHQLFLDHQILEIELPS